MSRAKDILNNRYGKLIVINRSDSTLAGLAMWECLCDCGATSIVAGSKLRNGNTASCGCSNKLDLANKKFGMLLVIKNLNLKSSDGSYIWECICDCGNIVNAISHNLQRGNVKSCGCLAKHNLVNKTFGRLTVLFDSGERTLDRAVLWKCKCSCGNETTVRAASLLSNHTRSCGCLEKEVNLTHGMTGTPVYMVWSSMISRCTNLNMPNYSVYGGRGIRVCDRWLNSFENFYTDMGPRPSLDHSIDRRDNDGNYEPSNCRWATRVEQCNNKSNNVVVNYKGKYYTVAQLSREFNIDGQLVYKRLARGWLIEDAIETPSR